MFFFVTCKERAVGTVSTDAHARIYDFDNNDLRAEYTKLGLDSTHANLLNPRISQTDFDQIMKTWTDLHENIVEHLDRNGFTWQTKERNIEIPHKFYFEPNGKIKSYFFRVYNEDATPAKRREYARLISGFAKSQRIEFKSTTQFAQCGKTKYPIK